MKDYATPLKDIRKSRWERRFKKVGEFTVQFLVISAFLTVFFAFLVIL